MFRIIRTRGGCKVSALTRHPKFKRVIGAVRSLSVAPADLQQLVDRQLQVHEMVRCFRDRGHLKATLDPISTYETRNDKKDKIGEIVRFLDKHSLHPDVSSLLTSPGAATDPVYTGTGGAVGSRTHWESAHALALFLDEAYSGNVGVEAGHIECKEQVAWLQDKVENLYGPRKWQAYGYESEADIARHKTVLRKLINVQCTASFFRQKYPRSKVFDIDGGETILTGLFSILETGSSMGAEAFYMGMPHRGRMNLLRNFFSKSLEIICTKFSEAEPYVMHDVKFHAGAREEVSVLGPDGVERKVRLSLSANPSHLELVNSVVLGKTRAVQFSVGDEERTRIIPMLIHGDAAFAAEGIVPETMELSCLPGYTSGGCIHMVLNNQVGFTTGLSEGRSSYYCTSMAKVVQAPVLHVNGDDVQAVIAVSGLAAEFRQTFKRDVVVDVVCYRRFGHSSLENPLTTQPLIYQKIAQHPTVVSLYTEELLRRGILTQQWVDEVVGAVLAENEAEYEKAMAHTGNPAQWLEANWQGSALGEMLAKRPYNQTGVRKHVLKKVGQRLANVPDDFVLHPEVRRLLRQRKTMIDTEDGINMGFAELLAFGALVRKYNPLQPIGKNFSSSANGNGNGSSVVSHGDLHSSAELDAEWGHWEHPEAAELLRRVVNDVNDPGLLSAHPTIHIRLTGQDVVRGSFNQRHSSIYCQKTGREHKSMDHIGDNCATMSIVNSNLSEMAALGFEYGYSLGNELALVVWEAQFGDFANMAQAIIDNFIASGESKWGNSSSIVLLLPHGYDGQGPEHSSGRIERFLQLVNEDDFAVPGNNYIIRKEMEAGFDALLAGHVGDAGDDCSDGTGERVVRRRHFVDAIMQHYASVNHAAPLSERRMSLMVSEILEEFCEDSDIISKQDWCNMMSSWLQANAERNRNIVVVNPSSPAQYFHALRRQIHRPYAKPLICMSPKFLHHHKSCTSPLSDMTTGTYFHRVILEGSKADNMRHRTIIPEDPAGADSNAPAGEADDVEETAPREVHYEGGPILTGSGSQSKLLLVPTEIKRVIFLTGKLFYPLFHARQAAQLNTIALVRVEQLSPFPYDLITSAILKYPNADDLVWCQEEPKNMGAWSYIMPRFDNTIRENGIRNRKNIRYIGRPSSSSPATGSFKQHMIEQQDIISKAMQFPADERD